MRRSIRRRQRGRGTARCVIRADTGTAPKDGNRLVRFLAMGLGWPEACRARHDQTCRGRPAHDFQGNAASTKSVAKSRRVAGSPNAQEVSSGIIIPEQAVTTEGLAQAALVINGINNIAPYDAYDRVAAGREVPTAEQINRNALAHTRNSILPGHGSFHDLWSDTAQRRRVRHHCAPKRGLVLTRPPPKEHAASPASILELVQHPNARPAVPGRAAGGR